MLPRIENTNAARIDSAMSPGVTLEPNVAPESAVELAADRPVREGASSRAPGVPAADAASASTALNGAQLGNLSMGLLALADPMSMLMAIASHERAQGERVNTDRAQDAGRSAEAAANQRMEAAEKAQAAARKAHGLLKFAPKWVKKMIGGIIAAVGVVGAAFTGGASLALAIAAVVLLAAGDIVDAAVSRGWIKPDKAQWVSLGLHVAGAVLMSVSGVGAAEGAGTLAQVASTASRVAKVVEDVNEIKDAVLEAVAAGLEFKSAKFQRHAEAAGLEVDAALQDQEAASDSMRSSFQSYARVAQRVQSMQATRQQAAMAQARSLA